MDSTHFISIDKTITYNKKRQNIYINHTLIESKCFETKYVKLFWDISTEFLHYFNNMLPSHLKVMDSIDFRKTNYIIENNVMKLGTKPTKLIENKYFFQYENFKFEMIKAPTKYDLPYVILTNDKNHIELNLFEILKLCKVIEMMFNFENFLE